MTAKFLLSHALICLAAIPVLSAQAPKTVWQGAYTEAQAKRGEATYSAECARCHRDDLTGYNSVLIGSRFMNDWREDTVDHFFSLVKQTMPRTAPSSLTDGQYLDIVSYVLKMNDFPAGAQELTMNDIGGIRVESKEGPEPVPDFSLVEVVACLVKGSDGAWMLTNATEPVRTRDPEPTPAEKVKALATKRLGTRTFRVLDATSLPSNPPLDHKVDAKGLLIMKTGDDRLNVTSVQAIADSCGK
jgi:S-disulfanyl-L-cysteine oxidoreductase SoxD